MNMLMAIAMVVTVLAKPEPVVLLDQSFDLLHGEGAETEMIGTYTLRAEEVDGQLTIFESIEKRNGDTTFGMSSKVVYQENEDKAWVPATADATTVFNGNKFMTVQVKADGDKWELSAALHIGRDGAVLDQPRQMTRVLDVPDGPVLFSSARAVIGPRLLPKAGELPVVWVEFPDDLDEAINIKEGFTLIRSEPDDVGGYTINLRSEHQEIGKMPLNKDGQIRPHALWGKIQLRERQAQGAEPRA